MSEETNMLQTAVSQPPARPVLPANASSGFEAARGSVSESADAEEALRIIQQVFLLSAQQPPRVVVFAGIDHGNGCSRVAASVAEVLARNSRKPVCLVEANFRSPGLSALFRAGNQQGLTDALRGGGPIRSFAKPVAPENLWLLPSGPLASDSPNLLASDILQYRLEELRGEFETVIVDAPPLNGYADAVLLGQRSDGMVLILEAETTRREAASAMVSRLRSAHVNILAAVLNKRIFPIPEGIYQRL